MFSKNNVAKTDTKPVAKCPHCGKEIVFEFRHDHTTTTTSELVKITKKK